MDWKEWGLGKIADLLWSYLTRKNNVTDNRVKRNIIEVIKNEESPNSVLVKSKVQDFNSNSILIVMPGEEAVFINNGRIEKKFGEGRYKLSTSNYPFLSDLIVVISGKRIFSSNIYFIKSTISDTLDWGTSIQVRDPKQLVSTRVMCRGIYKVQISNSESFIRYCMGNGCEKLEQHEFNQLFRDEIIQTIKSKLTDYILKCNHEIIGINRYQSLWAEEIGKNIENVFVRYGFRIVSFVISGIDILNDKRREKIEEAYCDKRTREI